MLFMSTRSENELFSKNNEINFVKDENALRYGFNENKLRFRDSELKLLKKFSHIYVDENIPFDIEIIGDTCTGKTHLIHELSKYINYFNGVKIIDVEADSTFNWFLKQFYEKLTEKELKNTLHTTTFKEKIKEILREKPIKTLFIFDDVQCRWSSKKLHEIFDYLYNDYFLNTNCLVSMIRLTTFERINLRCKSNGNYINEEITLKHYSLNQIRTILKDKIDLAFYPEVISSECIDKLAYWASIDNNLNMSLNVLENVAFKAKKEGYDKIKYKHLEESYTKVSNLFI